MAGRPICSNLVSLLVAMSAIGWTSVHGAEENSVSPFVHVLKTYCLDCHHQGNESGQIPFDPLLVEPLSAHSQVAEKIVRKLSSRQMPPLDASRPSETEYNQAIRIAVDELDRHAAMEPKPGRTETFRRLTQAEYQNAIRDLLGINVDVSQLLPADESSHGFDNVTVANLSPVLLDRYVSAAQWVSRLAVGNRSEQSAEKTYRVPPDVTQDSHWDGAPLGTRGGMVIQHNFPQSGEYEIQAWLMRDRNDEIESLRGSHQLDMLLDRALVADFTIEPPTPGSGTKLPSASAHREIDAQLKVRIPVTAGSHEVSVVFRNQSSSLLESVRQPLNVHFNFYRHPRLGPALYQVTIRGPFDGVRSDETPSRKRIFVSYPTRTDDENACAETILANIIERAYRREIAVEDLEIPLNIFRETRRSKGFETGIEMAVAAVLVNPQFLFRIERDPSDIPAATPYQVSSIELASRLSFFLWSSIPDDELRQLAIDGELSKRDVLLAQVRRMLSDPRSESLVRQFAGQWLYLRNLDAVIPDMRLFPDFDDNLRQAFRRETELFFGSILREDRSALDLLRADYTYLNERLAKHYGIDYVFGSHFRRVSLVSDSHRGGILRQGSVLTVTSYATRTSPVLRGNWVLENLLGSPPPPPPPNVPTLVENTVQSTQSVRERLEQHRANATCASCHDLIDPIGFALENYDAIGRWRETENDVSIDVSGTLVDGRKIVGVSDLEQSLLDRPELFVQTLTEKLTTFALGRGIEEDDAPAVRRVVREAKQGNYRFSQIILGIVQSDPFQMRKSR